MADQEARRVSVQDTRRKLQSSNPPLFVCIYPNDQYRDVNLEGSIGREEFEKGKSALARNREIIFY